MRTWKVTGVPQRATTEKIIAMLNEAGLEEVNGPIDIKRGLGKTSTYFFKARAKDGDDLDYVDLGDMQAYVEGLRVQHKPYMRDVPSIRNKTDFGKEEKDKPKQEGASEASTKRKMGTGGEQGKDEAMEVPKNTEKKEEQEVKEEESGDKSPERKKVKQTPLGYQTRQSC